MSNDAFDGQILAEKLSKLNNSQQSIESLSRWCVTHRKKARQIVETWDKCFNSSQKEQRISFLYLANDILQTSRRKGSEFVNEFWKILPTDLKLVYESGEHGKKVVTRLVDIWEERKVFGSRGQGLKDELLGKNPPTQAPPTQAASNGKSSNSNPVKIVKRDAQSVRIKLAVGAMPEKILTAFQSVLEELANEESALNKSNTAASHLGKVSENLENASTLGNQNSYALVDELQEQENILQQCITQLESAEATRVVLVSQLKAALEDQESKLELIRSGLQIARGQVQQANNLKKMLTSPAGSGPLNANIVSVPSTEAIRVVEHNTPPVQPHSTPPQQALTQPVVSYAPLKPSDEESKRAAAAAMAAKLAASTSSAQMLTSVLSSLVAEEAASLNGSLKSSGFNMLPPEKRPKLDKPMPVSDVTNSDGNTSYFSHLQPQQGNSTPGPPPGSMQPVSQSNQMQAPFGALPPLPPPPPMSSANPQANQYVQSAGMMVGVMPYGFGANALPPPPPPPHIAMGMARPGSQASQQSQPQQPQQQQQQQQQTPATGGYYRPPGIGFYGQNHPSTTQPVPRQ